MKSNHQKIADRLSNGNILLIRESVTGEYYYICRRDSVTPVTSDDVDLIFERRAYSNGSISYRHVYPSVWERVFAFV